MQRLFLLILVAGLAAGCSSLSERSGRQAEAARIIESVRTEVAPNAHLQIYRLGLEKQAGSLVLTGEVQSAEAKRITLQRMEAAGIPVKDAVTVLPQADLGEHSWAIAAISLCNGREETEHRAELGTQLLMGDVVRVWKRSKKGPLPWVLVQSRDGYTAWQMEGSVVLCTEQEARAWEQGPLVIVTAFESSVLSQPDASSEPVSDAVLLNRFKFLGNTGAWTRVQLPDGRTGFIPSKDIEDYQAWKSSRQPTAENIERTARSLMGRPYLWGANSPRGLDCSGLTKIVFACHGIDLMRNASHQATQGRDVPLDPEFRNLKKGDLLFFGRSPGNGKPVRISHTAIYLGGKEFIHSAETVHVSSLDPAAPNRDEHYMKLLLKARRLLPE